jgi:hypothetical protein
MDAHVEKVTTAATAKCLALARLKGLRPKQMRQLYQSVVVPTRNGCTCPATVSSMGGHKAYNERSGGNEMGRFLLPARRLQHEKRIADGKASGWP